MKLSRGLFALPSLLLAACGAGSADPAFLEAAPGYAALAMDQTGADPVASGSPGALTLSGPQASLAPGDRCHPHLFIRTHEVAFRVNAHLLKFLRHVDFAMGRRPRLAVDGQHVWERTLPSGVSVRFTMTRTGDVFTWLLELAPPGGTFTRVFWGEIDRSGAAAPHQGTGTLTLDLTALHSVVPRERATGVVSASFESGPASRWIVVDAAQVAWEVDPARLPPGIDPAAVSLLEQPRSAHYVYFRERGRGGSLKVKDQMVFLCPMSPALKLSDAVVVGRWYRRSDGSLHGRSDGEVTGGQLPDLLPPVAKVVGVTCHQGPTETDMPAETFWLVKAEAQDGSTLAGWSSEAAGAGPSACDPALGATVPDLVSSANDFVFPPGLFTTSVDLAHPANQPYPFPGM